MFEWDGLEEAKVVVIFLWADVTGNQFSENRNDVDTARMSNNMVKEYADHFKSEACNARKYDALSWIKGE